MMQGRYQVGILGRPDGREQTLAVSLDAALGTLGIDATALSVIAENDIRQRDRKSPFIGVFFGYKGADDRDHPILADLLEDSVVIVPLVPGASSTAYIPKSLHHINFLELSPADAQLARLTTLLLENFQVLRPERRLFISYRRVEAQRVAIQLYEKLDSGGFDVFLDTHGVPPAADFQSILWHRLADSDVVVLLDTPNFRESRWTREELARAMATNIQILQVLWPGANPQPTVAFSAFYQLNEGHFIGNDQVGAEARLQEFALVDTSLQVESLRAHALAGRHRYLIDNFCDHAQELGKIALVQSSRLISLEISKTKKIAVVPAVGVPTAARYQQIETAILASGTNYSSIWLLYDERGILDTWLDHVGWLNRYLPLRAVPVDEAATRIKAETP